MQIQCAQNQNFKGQIIPFEPRPNNQVSRSLTREIDELWKKRYHLDKVFKTSSENNTVKADKRTWFKALKSWLLCENE